MGFVDIIKQVIPFVIGLLIGAGLTKNKYVFIILISYMIGIVLFSLLKNKIMNIKESEDKKQALKNEAMETVKDVGEATLKGNKLGASQFDKFYKEFSFYFGITLFLSTILLLILKLWYWSLICFLAMIFFIALNQNIRNTREIKEYIYGNYK